MKGTKEKEVFLVHKMLGNGWTVEIIFHSLQNLKLIF